MQANKNIPKMTNQRSNIKMLGLDAILNNKNESIKDSYILRQIKITILS